jgi:predicted DNA-binding transcriptional regulator AlpA
MILNYMRERQVIQQYPVVSKALLRKMRREGTGPEYIKLQRMVIYSRTAIEAWLAAHTVRTRATA